MRVRLQGGRRPREEERGRRGGKVRGLSTVGCALPISIVSSMLWMQIRTSRRKGRVFSKALFNVCFVPTMAILFFRWVS